MLLGSHVSMSGKEMMLLSAKEAASYKANTMMVYTGAPQNINDFSRTSIYASKWN